MLLIYLHFKNGEVSVLFFCMLGEPPLPQALFQVLKHKTNEMFPTTHTIHSDRRDAH